MPSWVSEFGAGQSLNVGQPTGSWVGSPDSTASSAAPLPPVALWSGQSTSAYGAPYSCQGRPQWTPPPRNSKAMPCVCASTYPRTSWNGETPAIGAPWMPICDSG